MFPKRFALIAGAIMLAMGVVSLIPAFVGSLEGLPPLVNETSYGLFLGIFPMNIYNKIALIFFGLTGLGAGFAPYTSLPRSIRWSRSLLYVMAPLAILGLFPQTQTLGGYWPLFGMEAGLHAVVALLGAYFGFALTAKVHHQEPHVRAV